MSRQASAGFDRVERVRELWAAFNRGELGPLEAALEPQARWRAVEDGPWNCDDRRQIMAVLREGLGSGRISGRLDDAFALGERVVVGFRPDANSAPQWPLEDGVRWMVVTMRGDLIAELKGCADRASALAYASAD